MDEARRQSAAQGRGSRNGDDTRRACASVIQLVSAEKRVPRRMFTDDARCRNTASRARQLAMYLSHVALGRSLAEVGTVFGRDRTTVSHACAVIEDLREDPAFDAEVSRLERAIEAQGQPA